MQDASEPKRGGKRGKRRGRALVHERVFGESASLKFAA